MSDIRYNIISTGSKGNAVVIEDEILIDCGVPFKALQRAYLQLKLVLLTHIHSDHFNPKTLGRLAMVRPTLRFVCAEWLVAPLVQCGVDKKNIDVVIPGKGYKYTGICNIFPVSLKHNVPNIGYKIHFPDGRKMIYCTDTNNLNGIVAPNYNLYMIEANYEDEEIRRRIADKKAEGEFVYETAVLENHLSKQKCDEFIYKNIGNDGVYIYMHQHHFDEEENGNKI